MVREAKAGEVVFFWPMWKFDWGLGGREGGYGAVGGAGTESAGRGRGSASFLIRGNGRGMMESASSLACELYRPRLALLCAYCLLVWQTEVHIGDLVNACFLMSRYVDAVVCSSCWVMFSCGASCRFSMRVIVTFFA